MRKIARTTLLGLVPLCGAAHADHPRLPSPDLAIGPGTILVCWACAGPVQPAASTAFAPLIPVSEDRSTVAPEADNPRDIPEAPPTAEKGDYFELSEETLAIVGDPEFGEYLASECLTCHKSDGSYDGIPVITEWPAEDFVYAMHEYKEKLRPHPVMQMMASRLTDEEIAALAAYFELLVPEDTE